jgi:arsenate reductase
MISSFISRALTEYVEQRHSEADGYTSSTGDDGERRDKLHAIESCVLSAIGAGGLSRLVFLCTHNSRRSQLAQVWFAVAAAYYGLHVEAASAGLEVTKVPEQIMRVLRDVGFEVVDVASDDRAEQQHFCDVRFSSTIAPVRLYSKLLGDLTDDVKNRCIIAVCSDADQRCPAGIDNLLFSPTPTFFV